MYMTIFVRLCEVWSKKLESTGNDKYRSGRYTFTITNEGVTQ